MKQEILHGDCLELMKEIPDKSIDMILCDLPYGTTACKWDTIIPLVPLWEQYKRIIKDNGAIVLFGSQPFTSALVMSNPKMFKYDWVWDKGRVTGVLNAKHQPLRCIENILVFYSAKTTYNPQGVFSCNKKSPTGILSNGLAHKTTGNIKQTSDGKYHQTQTGYPKQIIKIKNTIKNVHPTQKPVELFEYLIKTYTNEGDLVLDNCAGSGTTGVACKNLNRQFILMEKEQEYIDIIHKRLPIE